MRQLLMCFLVFSSVSASAGTLQHPDNLAMPIVQIEGSGGLCADGVKCHQMITTLYDNGKCEGECSRPEISDKEVGELQDAIRDADFSVFKEKTPGTCPSAHDGQDIIYIFRADNGDQRINSCVYAVDMNLEPFKTLQQILEKH